MRIREHQKHWSYCAIASVLQFLRGTVDSEIPVYVTNRLVICSLLVAHFLSNKEQKCRW